MEKIFFASIALLLSASTAALPLKLWEAGGQIRDVHLQNYSSTSPNPNAEKNVIYSNTSADNAGYIYNSIRITAPAIEDTASERFNGSQGLSIEPGSSFLLGYLSFINWGLFEGSETIDLEALFLLPDSNEINRPTPRTILSLEASFDVTSEGNDKLVKFTPTTKFANFSNGGNDYNLSINSICKIGSPTTDCGLDQTWFSLADNQTKFGIYATLGNGSYTNVPEPSSLGILLAGLVIFATARRRKFNIR